MFISSVFYFKSECVSDRAPSSLTIALPPWWLLPLPSSLIQTLASPPAHRVPLAPRCSGTAHHLQHEVQVPQHDAWRLSTIKSRVFFPGHLFLLHFFKLPTPRQAGPSALGGVPGPLVPGPPVILLDPGHLAWPAHHAHSMKLFPVSAQVSYYPAWMITSEYL